MTNPIKHSHASETALTIRSAPRRIHTTVVDDTLAALIRAAVPG